MHADAQNMYSTPADYLTSLTWDYQPRLDRWLIECAQAEDTPEVRAASSEALITAVQRAKYPGFTTGKILLLQGGQGQGKSSALHILANQNGWFSDTFPFLESDLAKVTAGKWIFELNELEKLSPLKIRALKAVLSRKADVRRSSNAVARAFTVIGTTNSGVPLYLSRLFRPVTVQTFDLEKLQYLRDQLWAEATMRASKRKKPPVA